jgi:NagD protein
LLPTASETIGALRSLGKRTLFLSNNPTRPRAEYAQKLTDMGIATNPQELLNSSYVMVKFLLRHMPGSKLFVVGEASLCRELQQAGFRITTDPLQVDAVIASFDRTFDYGKLQIAFDAIRAGARFFATNADRFCPVPGGGQPDAAAIIAAIEACTGVQVEAIVGKPFVPMAEAILNLLALPPERCLIVGDRLETDVMMGLNAGMSTALALTGATDRAQLADATIKPDYILCQLADILPESTIEDLRDD